MPREETAGPPLRELLACPRDGLPVSDASPAVLECTAGHRYPVINGVPVMLLEGGVSTVEMGTTSWRRAQDAPRKSDSAPELYLDTLGVSDAERRAIDELARSGPAEVDPVVQYLIGATCGTAYLLSLGKLAGYPIPEIPVPPSVGGLLIDLGCNWGRWSMAAARKGYRAIGLDPQLGAVLAAQRVARQLGLSAEFVCADARHLPFRTGSVDVAFSYSVLQHFSEVDCAAALKETARVLRGGAKSVIQMANAWGLRSAYYLLRRGLREPRNFEVRYYSPAYLLQMFREHVGESYLVADCYLGLGLQAGDRHLYPASARIATSMSETMKRLAAAVPVLTRFADSLYVRSVRR